MSENHVFLIVKDLSWDWFNILTVGCIAESPESSVLTSIFGDTNSLVTSFLMEKDKKLVEEHCDYLGGGADFDATFYYADVNGGGEGGHIRPNDLVPV